MKEKRSLFIGVVSVALFVVWTVMIQNIDLKPIGPNGSIVGFATLNGNFHKLTGVNFGFYNISDWLGLVPIFCCIVFGALGLAQLIKRKSIFKVDRDILLLGIYYIAVIFEYLIFEAMPINYRPVLINGILEASYPSSTTLLVLSVMPTVIFQADRRVKKDILRRIIKAICISFIILMVLLRTFAGVHWLTDIIGGALLSFGSYLIYRFMVLKTNKKSEV